MCVPAKSAVVSSNAIGKAKKRGAIARPACDYRSWQILDPAALFNRFAALVSRHDRLEIRKPAGTATNVAIVQRSSDSKYASFDESKCEYQRRESRAFNAIANAKYLTPFRHQLYLQR